MKQIYKFIIPLLCAVTVCISGCDKNRIYETNKELNDYIWIENEILDFEFDIVDTTAVYNILINVRHTVHYMNSNLYVQFHLTDPSGKKITELSNVLLADVAEEKWKGEAMGDIVDLTAELKGLSSIKFHDAGKYKISLEQFMRMPKLIGVMAIGVRVEKVELIEEK